MMLHIAEPHVSFLLAGLWRASWQASLLAAVVLLIQWMTAQRLGGRGRYALWMIVLIRLLLPVLPESRASLFNLTQKWAGNVQPHDQPAVVDAEVQSDQPTAERAGPQFIVVGEDRAATVLPATSAAVPIAAAVAAPIAATRSHPHWSLLHWVALIWVVGAVILAMQVLLACWKLSRLIRRVPICGDPHLLQMLRSCGNQLKLRRLPRMRIGDAFRTPAIVGVLRPTLLLPAAVVSSCSETEIRLVILHELAHLKRRDVPANWLIAFATILHWFNPIVWLAAARMRSDRELACDELVLSFTNESAERQAYGETLVKLIEILAIPGAAKLPRQLPRQMIGMVGILEQTRPMQRRVRMIARFNPKQSRQIWTYGILILLASVALTDAVHGDAKSDAKKSKSSSGAQPATQPVVDTVIDGTQTNSDLKAKLNKTIGDLGSENLPLSAVIDQLRTQSTANIDVNWKVLEAAGITTDTPISVSLKNVTLKQALDHVLADAGGQSVKLGFTVFDGAIVVDTADQMGAYKTTVAYDISDLMGSATTKPSDEAESIIRAIEATIDPDSWKDSGGQVGTIQQLNGKLIVQHTEAVQEQIADFFKMLHEQPKAQPAASTDGAGSSLFGGQPSQPGQAMMAGQSLSQPHTVVADAEMDAAISTARSELNHKLPDVKFNANPLSDVIDFYRDTTGANIVVNWSMLKPLNINSDSACSLQLKDATLEKCLEATFKQFDGGSLVAIVVDRNVLTITSQMDIPSYLVTKTYHVKDLIFPNNTNSNLIAVVQNLIQDQPGGGGTVLLFGDNLVVTTPLTSQDQVAKLLESLRSGASTQPTAEAGPNPFDGTPPKPSK